MTSPALFPDQPISVVIPSFNGKSLLKRHLPAVFAALRSRDQVVIVDDASGDRTVEWLTQTYRLKPREQPPAKQLGPRFKSSRRGDGSPPPAAQLLMGKYRYHRQVLELLVVANTENLRFAASVNRAVKLARYKLVCLLNNDVRPEPDFLKPLLEHFQHPEMFAVGCLEKEQSGTSTERLSGKNRLWFERGLYRHSRAREFGPGPTAWVSGGSGLFSRPKWLELGGYDPAFYPAYWEDIDISFRARQRGWRVWFESRSVVHHLHETTNRPVFGDHIERFSWRHGLYFTWKHASWRQRLLFVIWQPYWWLLRSRSKMELAPAAQ
ncbi:MAG: hypothetical protein COU69_01565 [Candidatus Pacebacteria bacterium CG10_big_fil_rev_8_21_14_0_10_56_10]|nr:MAG: hypothetical protein COU69_01565 [Candidatus Pacebacteria bacterium CG10_big_fil_rev_8_21_14_0_10_56_10]